VGDAIGFGKADVDGNPPAPVGLGLQRAPIHDTATGRAEMETGGGVAARTDAARSRRPIRERLLTRQGAPGRVETGPCAPQIEGWFRYGTSLGAVCRQF
jgi:hypothetical protein